MKKPTITMEQITPAFDGRFIRIFDLEYEPGKHYLDASRRKKEDLAAPKSDAEFRQMLPDAVSCVVVLNIRSQEPRLLLTREYRFPAGRFLLSVPAGLLDPSDAASAHPVLEAARREIREETGITVEETDTVRMINPLLLSSPGMTDESNALVLVTLNRDTEPDLSQAGATGSECFDGFVPVTRKQAEKLLETGADSDGIFYSVYTWMALMCFATGLFDGR